MGKEERKYINIGIPTGLLKRIDTYAEHHGINRTAAIMFLASSSLDTFEKEKTS